MAQYYVSSGSGNDGWAGTIGAPWKTLNQVWNANLPAGSIINLKRGDRWDEDHTIRNGGTAGNPVVYQAYGSGALPIISGSDKKTGWTFDSNTGSLKVYAVNVSSMPRCVWIDGNEGRKQTSKGACDYEFDWYHSSGVLYLCCTDDPDTAYSAVEVQVRDEGIYSINLNYITLKYLQLQGAIDGCYLKNCDYGRIEWCTGVYNADNGLRFGGSNFVYIGWNTTHHNGELGIRHMADLSGPGANDGLVEWNYSHDDGTFTYSEWYQKTYQQRDVYTAGIKLWGAKSQCKRNIVQHNIVHDAGPTGTEGHGGDPTYGIGSWAIAGCGVGIWNDETGAFAANDGNIYRYNTIYDCNASGIDVEQSHHTQVYMNVLWNNAKVQWRGQILVRRRPHDNRVFNNICMGPGYAGIAAEHTGQSSGPYYNNWFINNICVGNTYEVWGCRGSFNVNYSDYSGYGNRWEYNLLGPERTNFAACGAIGSGFFDNVSTYAELEDSSHYNASTYSIRNDPTFVDSGARNYRPLSEASPQVNAGIDIGLAVDFDQTLLPQGGAYDVGAFEWTEESAVPSATAAIGASFTDFALPAFTIQQYSEQGEFLDSIVDPDGGDYLTISAWNAARGGLNPAETCVSQAVKPRAIVRCTGGTGQTDRCTMGASAWGDVSASYHPVIYVDPDYRDGFKVPTSGNLVRLITTGDSALDCEVDHTEIYGLAAKNVCNGDYDATIKLTTAEGILVDRCVASIDAGGNTQPRIFSDANASGGVNHFRNCLAADGDPDDNSKGFWVHQRTGGLTRFSHCSSVANNDGFYVFDSGGGSALAINCLVWGLAGSGHTQTDFIGTVLSAVNCAGNDGTPFGTGHIDLSSETATDLFRNWTANDYRALNGVCPISGVVDTLFNDGSYPVVEDIEGNARASSGLVAVGASESVGAVIGVVLPSMSPSMSSGESAPTGQAAFVATLPSFGIATVDADISCAVSLDSPRLNFLVPTSERDDLAAYRAGRKPHVDILKWWRH